MRFLKLFLSSLLLTTFSIGQTRGATQTGSLTFDFEDNTAHRTDGSNNYAAAGNSYSENGVSISCTYMDIVTNNGRLSGSADAMGRIAKNTTNSPTLIIGPIDMNSNTITGISYYVKGVAAMAQICSYSTNGTSWTTAVGIEGGAMPTSKILKESETLSVAGTSTFYVKILTSVSGSTNSNRDVQIDDIVISYTYEESGGSTPSVSADPDEVTDVVAEGVTNQTIELTYENIENYETEVSVHPNADGTGTLSSAWLTASVSDVDDYATVTYSVAANDGDARTAYIKVYTTDGDKEATTIVPISQVKYSAPTGTFKLYSGDISEGDYVIVSTNALSNTVNSNRLASQAVSISDGKIINPDVSIIWHIAQSGEYWTVYNEDASKYAGGTTTKNQGALLADVTDYAKWTITEGTGIYEFVNLGRATGSSDTGNKYLRYNSGNAENSRWACYGSGTGSAPALYKLDDGKPSAPTFSPAGGSFFEAQSVTLGAETGTTIYYTTDGTAPSTSSSVYSAAIPVGTTTTIKAIAVKDDKSSGVASATYTIISVDHAGTAADPYSVADARTVIDAGIGLADKYVRGIVSEIVEPLNTTYHNISYNFSDDGLTTSAQLEAYRGKSYNGDNFTSEDDIQVGDDVIVFGTLKKYDSTYKLDAGNQLVKRSAHLAWSGTTEGAYAASLEGGNTFPTLTNSDNVSVSYSSSETSVATINASNGNIDLVGAGSTNITATFTGNDTYFEKSASYTLNVSSTVIKADILFEENGGSAVTDMQAQSNLPSPLPTTTKAGYNFGGWFMDSEFNTSAVAGAAVTSSDPITLYAQWLDPYSVGVALTMINALADNEKTDNVYVIGVVDNHATSLSSTSINYNIKDANASNTLAVYKGKGLKTDLAPTGEDVTSADYVQEGDQVVVYGQLYKYVDKNSNTTPEIAQGSYILSKVRPTTAVTGVTLPETATVRAGKTIALTATIEPSNATNKNVTWSVTSGTDYAEVDENGVVTGKAEGTATIQVETEDGGFTASCTVTVLAGVNFADGDWMLVTDAAELTANSYVIIAAADYGKAMKPYESGNNCKSKDATKSGSMLTYDSDFGVFEIKAGNKENTIALSDVDNGSYLYAASSSSNYLKAEETLSNNSSWAVDVTSAGMATLIAQGNYTRNILKYNSANDQLLFSCYASSSTNMKNIALYKYYAPVPKVIYNKNTDDEVTNMPGVTRAELEGEVYKATISTTVPHRSGYSFSGWKSGETTYNAGEKYTLTADITLNAQWTQLVGHHVTYVTTGTAPTDENLYYEGDKVTLALATGVSNPGYSFAGWNDGTNTYTAGYEEYVMPDNDVTFTAVWSRMSSQKWALVEDVNNIKTDGTEYIIVATGYDVAMSALSGKIYSTSDVIKNENTKTLTGPESMLKLTFETDLGSGKLAIKNGSKYISSTKVKEMTEGDDSFNWEISITDGVATISASVGNIRYNKDHPRFTTYASGQQDVALYVKVPMVEISTDVEASALSENADVVVHSNGTLTVDDDKTLGDLTVENGGKVVLSNKKLTVTNFVIETTMADHKSGQVDGALTTNFEAMGDAYIDITLGAGGTNQQWHAFTVPFPVDVLNGIFDLADNKLQNEVNYAIMDYHGDIRATGKYGWKKIRTTLVPGTFYIMATDGYRTTYRFKKKDGAALVAENSMSYSQYAESEAGVYGIDNGWNGIGNPNLFYGKVNLPVQVLNPATYTYEPYVGKDANSTNFIVGTPFFYQASGDGSIVMQPASGTTNYAPARYTMPKEIKDVEVRFGNEEYTDRLYISANEDALSTYETGKDLIKMTMTNTPKVAQIFGCAYDTKLCMVNAPLRNDQANFSLKLYAPADGEYTITIPEVDNADIYLTYDNRIIWNIAASEYNCELKAGETNNYGLILRMKAPQVTTGVEQGGVSNGANSVQKIIINDHVYILRGEKLYDVTGKMLR